MKIPPLTISICLLPALLATGLCLQCERCKSASRSCSGPLQTCGDVENACLTLTTETRTGERVKVVTYKGCTKLRHCPPGPFTVTTDLEERIRSNAECCCSNHCNKGGVKNETYVRRGCGTKRTCVDQLGSFGIPEMFLETVTQAECDEAT